MDKTGTGKELTVMKPFMPPLDEFKSYLERIWDSRRLSNDGAIHREFEQALCGYLGVRHISLFANGTLALMIAIKALDLKGEIITTPFTSVATAQAIYWNNLKPVFVDINKTDYNISLSGIEEAITPHTQAILPVHLFGNPCDLDGIERVAHKNKLKLVYDAAHCFGVTMKGISVCNFGDLSVLSFHATKVFSSFEGGAIICHDESTKRHIDALKNTGLGPDHKLEGYGINAKMNEFQAAYGLIQLKYVGKVIACRREVSLKYRQLFKGIRGLSMPGEKVSVDYNYSYFPVVIDPDQFGSTRDEVADYLEKKNIFARKYFYPLVCDHKEFSMYKRYDLSVARKTAENILCIPLFHDISDEDIEMIAGSIIRMNRVL
ncbi:MAG: DegT/DnrJ/EryC1/StrS family aminotransferase [bacterium]